MQFKQNKIKLDLVQHLIRLPLSFSNGGFTLLEILVVVLIIGILGAIMLPQYQRAVLKSKYASLMPIAKAMADSNEAYFLEHGVYADNAQDLPVQGRQNYPDGTEIEFGTDTDYSYVLATRGNDFPNNYIVYQKHSGEFPGEIHCEALANNDLAESVCKSFGGNESIGKTLTDGYETYVLFGTGNGVAPTGDEGENDEPEEPQTPACQGAAPTKQEGCPDGCGSVTVTATCEDGEWVYPTADTSSCPDKPDDETAPCEDSRYSGTQTRSATCNSTGTAWEFTGSWNTTGCTAAYVHKNCKVASSGACSNTSFSGGGCDVQTQQGCNNNIFDQSNCFTYSNSGYASGCNNGTFINSTCQGAQAGSCNGGTFKAGAVCLSARQNTCQSTFEEGSCCMEGNNGTGSCPKGTAKCVSQLVNNKWVYSPDPTGATW